MDDNDYRYPVTVTLLRDGRPKYWTFHCPYCTAKVCELDGTIVQVRDVSNDTANSHSAVRIKCQGTNIKSQGYCRMWFEIQLYN
jgi:hypothetical protein